ncbi:MAG: hypothetical protein SGPRY_013028, partial [Prymnesium sp.]
AGETDVVKAFRDLSSIRDVRFSVRKIFWAGFEFFDGLAARVCGRLDKWVSKVELRVRVQWEDEAVEPLALAGLLPCEMMLEPYVDNRPAPRPKRRRNIKSSSGAQNAASSAPGPLTT